MMRFTPKTTPLRALTRRGILASAIGGLMISTAMAQDFGLDIPHYAEVAEAAGITHAYTGPWEHFVGGGVASMDCNNDRMPDLFLAGGDSPAALYQNQSVAGGALAFATVDLGLDEKLLKGVIGAYPIDFNNDRNHDLVVLRVGENLLLQGDGQCGFTVANDAVGFDGGKDWTTAFSAVWEDGATFPTLAIGNYVDREADGSPWGTCADNYLMRPAAGAELSYAATALSPGYCTLSIGFTDWNDDGTTALRVANDRQYHRGGQEQLWDIAPGKAPRLYGPQDGWANLVIWGMGIAEADLTGDGKPEYAITSMGDTMLQTIDADADRDTPAYRDIAFERGTTAHRPYAGGDIKPSTGWHVQFSDVNNDSRQDLFIAKGNVDSMSDFASFDPDNLLMGHLGGKFIEQGAAAGIDLKRRGRGAAIEDFNADGLLDLVVVNRKEPVSLFQNLGAKTDWGHRTMGNFLSIELDNGDVNPDGIGALIQVKTGNVTQTRRVQIGGGHVSGQLGFTHFGLGTFERATVRVQWPGGDWSKEYRLFGNIHAVISRPNDAVAYWYPAQ